jgi:hypothetical protein
VARGVVGVRRTGMAKEGVSGCIQIYGKLAPKAHDDFVRPLYELEYMCKPVRQPRLPSEVHSKEVT